MERTYIFSNDSNDDSDYPGDGSEVLVMNEAGTGGVRPDTCPHALDPHKQCSKTQN